MKKINNVEKISIINFSFNVLLLIIKLLFGIISNSTAMISDAIHSIEDSFCSVISYIGARISSSKNNVKYPFGAFKAKYIFSFIISISMGLASYSILKNAIDQIVNPRKIEFSIFLIIICIVNIIIKFLLYCYNKKVYKKDNDILIKASMEDNRNDIFLTSTTLIGVTCGYFNIPVIDTLIGIIISAWIFCVAIRLFLDSYRLLMDTGLEKEKIESISNILLHENIKLLNVISIPVDDKYLIIIKIHTNNFANTYELLDYVKIVKSKIINDFKYVFDVVIDISVDI